MIQLTQRQKKVLEFIVHHIHTTGVPPTLREIMGHFQWSAVGSAQSMILALRKKGFLLPLDPSKARHVRPSVLGYSVLGAREPTPGLPPANPQWLHVPILGSIAAGNPIESIEAYQGWMDFPKPSHLQGGPLFALKVQGYSMLHGGFLPNDVVLVEGVQDASQGAIVVAQLEWGEVTIKRFAKLGSTLYQQAWIQWAQEGRPPAFLVPENPDFQPIPFGTHEEHQIRGVVRALVRVC